MNARTEIATLGLLLGRLERLNEQLVSELCADVGTTPAELRVLALLRLGPDSGPTSPSLIAGRIVQTTGGLTATLNRLERAGHVERLPDPDDGRGRLVQLTAAGAHFADRAIDTMADQYEVAFAETDTSLALSTVRTLIDVLERRIDHTSTGDWTVPARPVGSSA